MPVIKKSTSVLKHLKGYFCIEVLAKEYHAFIDIVLLKELKKLYEIKAPQVVKRLDKLKRLKLKEFKIEIPEYYVCIFHNKSSESNVELIELNFNDLFNFILRYEYNPNNYFSIDKFEQHYFEIIDKMNEKIIAMINGRKDSNKDIQYLKTRLGRISSFHIKQENAKNDILNDSQIINSTEIKPIIWHRSIKALEYLFVELFEKDYITNYDYKILHEHFIIKEQSTEDELNSKLYRTKTTSKLCWNKFETELVFLFDYLSKKGIISLSGNISYKAWGQLFCKTSGKNYNSDNFPIVSKNLESHSDGKWKSYPLLQEIIKPILQKSA